MSDCASHRTATSHFSVTDLAQISQFFEASPVAMLIVNTRGQIVLVNNQVCSLFGYAREELLGQTMEILVPEKDHARHPLLRDAYMKVPKARVMGAGRDLSARLKDGSEVAVEIGLNPLTTAQGAFVIAAIVDITERQKAREFQSRLAAIVESSEDAILTVSLDGVLTTWNKGATLLYGYALEEAIGKHLSMLIPSDSRGQIKEVFDRVRVGQHVPPYETFRIRKDGTKIPVLLSLSPLKNAQGEIIGASAIARDMTVQHKMEHQLRHAQKMELVGHLAGGVAHDFNNILTIISVNSALMLDRLDQSDPSRREVEEISDAVEQAAALTRQLLTFSRKQPLKIQALNVNQVIQHVDKMLLRILGEHYTLSLQLSPDIGLVKADATQLEQILMNFIINARDAMPGGGVLTICTAPALRSTGPCVMFSVTDTGVGMDEPTRAQIFEPFFTTKAEGKGTGLGLSTVDGILRQNNAQIEVYSEPHKGSTFKVFWPLNDLPSSKVSVAAPHVQTLEGTETILLVEDEAPIRNLVRRILTPKGYTILEARNGKEALGLIQHADAPIHLVITDMIMPELGGRALADLLAKSHPETKILFMSGYSEKIAEDKPLLDLGTPLLQKPFTPADLAIAVREVLNVPPVRSSSRPL